MVCWKRQHDWSFPMKKDPLSIFRLSVRTGWRWKPSCGLATASLLTPLVWQGLFFWFFFVVYHAIRWQETKIELQQPTLFYLGWRLFSHGRGWFYPPIFCASFPPLGSITVGLCGLPFSWIWANSLFYQDPCPSRPRANATPSWTVLYVGIAVAAWLISCRNQRIAYLALIGFGLTFLLYPLSTMIWSSPLYPVIYWAKKASIVLPFPSFSSLVRVGGASLPVWFLLIMVLASQGFISLFWRLPKMIRRFSTCFSALTFPTVITATSLKMAQGLLQLPPFLTALVWMETLLCLLIFSPFLGGYVAYLRE